MVEIKRLSGYDRAQSSPALCSLDRRETFSSSSPEAPCSSESEQSCLPYSHSRSLLVDNCCSGCLDRHAPSAKSAKRRRAEDLLERTYGKVQKRESESASQLKHVGEAKNVSWVDACESEDCSCRYEPASSGSAFFLEVFQLAMLTIMRCYVVTTMMVV